MDDAHEALKRYFQVQIDQTGGKPGLHKNRIQDCQHYLKALDETGSPAAFKTYVQQTGNMLSTGKAEARDRYENRLYLYEKLGSEKKAEADRMRIRVIDSANSHKELAQNLEEIEKKTHPLEQMENKAIMAASQVMKAFFHLATDPPGSEAQKRTTASLNEYWKQLKEADPDITWNKLVSYPPYRNRIIFTDAQLLVLKNIFAEVKHGRNS